MATFPILQAGYRIPEKGVTSSVRVCVNHSVMFNSFQPHGLEPARPSVYGILQARILEWVAIPFSRRFS